MSPELRKAYQDNERSIMEVWIFLLEAQRKMTV